MGGAGVRTVVIDSLTAIIAPITTQAVAANDAGENKNRIAAFRDKALALRLLRTPSRAGAATRCGSTITATPETARRRRSRRPRSPPWSSPACAPQPEHHSYPSCGMASAAGVKVEWARRGRVRAHAVG